MDTPYNLKRPKGVNEFILQKANNAYLIFDRKEDTTYCTRCGSRHQLTMLNDYQSYFHNNNHFCYDCMNTAVCKEKRYGRKSLAECGRILWFIKNGATTYAQLDEYDIDYSGVEPQIHYWISAQYELSSSRQKYYKHIPDGMWTCESWDERKEIKLPSPYSVKSRWGYHAPKYYKTMLYPEVERGTDLKYAKLCTDNPYVMIGYYYNFLRYPAIEMLESAGFYYLIEQKASGKGCRAINWRGKNLRKVLKLNFEEIRELKEQEEDFDLLQIYRDLHEEGIMVDFEGAAFVNQCRGYEIALKLKKTDIDADRTVRYLIRQNDMYDKHSTLRDYMDYLEFCRKLKIDMSKRKVLRPKNFVQEHDRLSILVDEHRDEIDREEFHACQMEITKMQEPFISGNLMIRPANGPEELTRESEALRHCVRTYKERVVRGETSILFVRTLEEPDKPFYTLELNGSGNIVQCRGFCNCSMTPEVQAFVEKWHSTWKKEHMEAA